MTHEPGSKMASKHACIILHIQVSAYAVLLNIPEVLALRLGPSGEGPKEFTPRRSLTCVSIASLMALSQPSVCTGQAPASLQPALIHRFMLS